MQSFMSSIVGRRIAVVVFFLILWIVPPPEGLSAQAMHLFAIFISAIFAVIINAMPILVSSLAALVVAVLTGTMETKIAYGNVGQLPDIHDCRNALDFVGHLAGAD